MNKLTKHDFRVINLNELHNGSPFPASPKKPTALVIWNDITPEEAVQLRDKILEWQISNIKLKEKTILVEEI